MITIKSKKEGFRRCGIVHPAAETSYSDDRFTKAEMALLKADPMLIVAIVEDKPASGEPASSHPLTGGDQGEGEQVESITKPSRGKGKK